MPEIEVWEFHLCTFLYTVLHQWEMFSDKTNRQKDEKKNQEPKGREDDLANHGSCYFDELNLTAARESFRRSKSNRKPRALCEQSSSEHLCLGMLDGRFNLQRRETLLS